MSEIPAFPYEILWGERSVRSVANLTRATESEFMRLAPRSRCAPGFGRIRSPRPKKRSKTCGQVGFTGQR